MAPARRTHHQRKETSFFGLDVSTSPSLTCSHSAGHVAQTWRQLRHTAAARHLHMRGGGGGGGRWAGGGGRQAQGGGVSDAINASSLRSLTCPARSKRPRTAPSRPDCSHRPTQPRRWWRESRAQPCLYQSRFCKRSQDPKSTAFGAQPPPFRAPASARCCLGPKRASHTAENGRHPASSLSAHIIRPCLARTSCPRAPPPAPPPSPPPPGWRGRAPRSMLPRIWGPTGRPAWAGGAGGAGPPATR
jgi:hypothetical protein